jgi:MFS family permease
MREMKQSGLFYGWWIVGAAVFVGLYVGGIIVYGFTAIFEPIVQEFGWSYAAISFAASFRGVESGLLEPVVGRLVDRWGPRRVVFAGGLFTAGGLFLLSNTTSLAMFYASFVLLAAGMSSCGTTVLVSAVANWFRARLAFATGIALSGFGVGGLVLPVMVALIARYGWRETFELLGIGALVLLVPLSLVFRHRPEDYGEVPDGRRSVARATPREGKAATHTIAEASGTTAGQAVRTPAFWLLTLAFTIHTAAVITTVTHVMPYLSSVGITRTQASLVATAIPLLSVLGRLGLGWAGDRVNRARLSVLSFGMMSLGFICFNAVPLAGGMALLLLSLLFGIGYGGVTALRPALTRQHFGGAHFGSVFGLLIGVNAIGGIAGPPLAGWSYDVSADYGVVWLALAVLTLVAAGLILLGERMARSRGACETAVPE